MTSTMITAPSLSKFSNIRHAFFTREGGVSDGIYTSLNGGLGSKDTEDNVRQNRARMAASLGVAPTHFVSCFQIHSPDVIVATEPWTRETAPRADAIVTRTPNLGIGVTTADCGPILFADGEAGVVGATHAGWKGAFVGVLEATIKAMEKLGAKRERIAAALGPMIRQKNYEVGPEFVERFSLADGGNARFFVASSRANHAMFDLGGYIAARLSSAGLTQIEDLGLCTYEDETRFFSYRRTTHRGEGDYGRHVNAIALVP
jgi:YfiH family protein